MALSPAEIDAIADEVVRVFTRLDTAMRTEAARQVTREGVTAASGRAAIAATASSHTAELERAVREAVTSAAARSLSGDEAIYAAARAAGLIGQYAPLADSVALRQLLDHGLSSTVGMANLVRTSAVNAASTTFTDALDRAMLGIATGVEAPDAAVRAAVEQIAQTATTVTYSSGGRTVEQSIYGAARRAVMTGAHQTVLRMQESRMREIGARYVEVSAHAGARPEHAEWQGEVYEWDVMVSTCGYGEVDGLGGANCRHSFYPYFPGIMEPTDNSYLDSRDAERDYELSQRQRLCERNIRDYQGRADVFRAGGVTEKAEHYDRLAGKWRAESRAVASERRGAVRLDRERPEPTYK